MRLLAAATAQFLRARHLLARRLSLRTSDAMTDVPLEEHHPHHVHHDYTVRGRRASARRAHSGFPALAKSHDSTR